MTPTPKISTVTAAIANLTVSGITMKGLGGIPSQGDLLGPIFFPDPSNSISDITSTRASLGADGTAHVDLSYNINYVFLYAPLEGQVGNLELMDDLVAAVELLLGAIMSHETIASTSHISVSGISSIGPISDASDNEYWGCFMQVHVEEYDP